MLGAFKRSHLLRVRGMQREACSGAGVNWGAALALAFTAICSSGAARHVTERLRRTRAATRRVHYTPVAQMHCTPVAQAKTS